MKKSNLIFIMLTISCFLSCEKEEENHAPIFYSINNQEVNQGSTISVEIKATDIDADKLSFSIVDNPGFLSLSDVQQIDTVATSLISISPTISHLGTFTIEITVIDSKGGTDTEEFEVSVVDDNFDYSTKIVYKSYHNNNFDIYIMNADGSGIEQLTDNPADDVEPSISQDQTKVVFESERSGNSDIWIMNSDGSNETQITTGSDNEVCPRFSPDGSKIVYASNSLVIMNADGSDAAEIDGTSGGRYPTFSSDASKIAYTSAGVGDIYIINTDGTNKTKITTNSSNSEWYPDFSPDGEQIIYTSITPTINMTLYSINVDGSNNTSIGVAAFHAVYSPDGTKIAFANSTINGNYDIFIMNLNGTGIKQLTTYSERDMAPNW